MGECGSLHATLISFMNRYVYQIGGSNPHGHNICRLDLDRVSDGWQTYDIHDKFIQVPRHFLDSQKRRDFDQRHPDYPAFGGEFLEDSTGDEDINR